MKHATLKRRRLRQAYDRLLTLQELLAEAVGEKRSRTGICWTNAAGIRDLVQYAAEVSTTLQEALLAAQWEELERRTLLEQAKAAL